MPLYTGEQVKPFRLYDKEGVGPFRLYDKEQETGEMRPIGSVLGGSNFAFDIPDVLWEDEYHKALNSLPWEIFKDQFCMAWARGIEKCESPIEKMLLPWLLQAQYRPFIYNPEVLLAGEADQYQPGTVAVIPQLPIGRFRADFALAFSFDEAAPRFFIVECDGKQFHAGDDNERRDANRDAAIRANKRVLGILRIEGTWIRQNAQQAAWAASRALTRALGA